MPPRCGIMSRVIAVTACGLMLAACSATMPSLNLDFMKSAPQAETLAIESEPPGAEAKTSIGQNCRTPCQLPVQPGRIAAGGLGRPQGSAGARTNTCACSCPAALIPRGSGSIRDQLSLAVTII